MESAHIRIVSDHEILKTRVEIQVHRCRTNDIPLLILKHEKLGMILADSDCISSENVPDAFREFRGALLKRVVHQPSG